MLQEDPLRTTFAMDLSAVRKPQTEDVRSISALNDTSNVVEDGNQVCWLHSRHATASYLTQLFQALRGCASHQDAGDCMDSAGEGAAFQDRRVYHCYRDNRDIALDMEKAVQELVSGQGPFYAQLKDKGLVPGNAGVATWKDADVAFARRTLLNAAMAVAQRAGRQGRDAVPSAESAKTICDMFLSSDFASNMSQEQKSSFQVKFNMSRLGKGHRISTDCATAKERAPKTTQRDRKSLPNAFRRPDKSNSDTSLEVQEGDSVDEVVERFAHSKLRMDGNGLMTSKEEAKADAKNYIHGFRHRVDRGAVTAVEAKYLCEYWCNVDAYLRAEECANVIINNELPLLNNRTLLDFHMSILLNRRPQKGVMEYFNVQLEELREMRNDLFLSRPHVSKAHEKALRERHQGISIPDEVVAFWMCMSNFGETLRSIRVSPKVPFTARNFEEVLAAKCPVVLMCFHDENNTVNEYALFCETELLATTTEVRYALCLYVMTWYLFNLKADGFDTLEEDGGVRHAKSMKRGRARRNKAEGEDKVRRDAVPRLKQTIAFLGKALLGVRYAVGKGSGSATERSAILALLKKTAFLQKERRESMYDLTEVEEGFL